MSRIGVSAVREILRVTEKPEIISFAGGLPAPELFPVEALARAHAEVFASAGAAAMQYSTTEGWGPLREWIASRLRQKGIDADPDRVLITSGSQQGIHLAAQVFLDPGDVVVVENPCYLAALQVFNGCEASFITVDSDDEGMRVDQLENVLRQSRPKLIYVVPNFHNPKGTTLSLARRERLVDLAHRYGVPILEDDPYGELRYQGEHLPPLAALDKNGMVIYLSTFSKTLSPGMRIGWLHASREVRRAIITVKQSADLHTSTIQQRAAARLLESFEYDGHVARICKLYGERCRQMLKSLEKHFPEETHWTRPEGGMFLWVELPEGIQGEELLEDALKERVAFVPGTSFFAENGPRNFIRLNFSNSKPAVIEEGIRRIGEAMQRRLI
ncbi:MAG TPA: PLP-dependent aminotransferase family protein [Blastocatellia bacterium]|nr:PLP-dependent aminotransferase family protein [Blastocatellia bacterium]